jgi:DNA-binding Lrp family transcriptional regulator
MGHGMTAIVHISLSGQFEKSLTEFEAAIKRCPNVLSCHLMSGRVRLHSAHRGQGPRRL